MTHNNEGLVASIKEKMEDISSVVFIFKVPHEYSYQNERAYTPNKVSIGPFHYRNSTLQAMEDHKWRYLNALLTRKSNPEASLDQCVKVLKELEHRARRCYGEKIDLTSDDFVQMMLVDGGFLIELFLRYAMKTLRRPNDPIFTTPGMLFELRCDMILLENQIPFSVLQELFKTVPIPEKCTQAFNELAFKFFANLFLGDQQVLKEKFCQEGYHLLDQVRHCMLPTCPKEQPQKAEAPKVLESATKLKKGGIKLKSYNAKSLSDVKFTNGVLSIPQLKYHDCVEKLLWNLFVFEHLHFHDTRRITSYACLMACLICSHKDVKLLGQQQILSNFKGKEKDIAEVFRKIREKVNVEDSHYSRLLEQVNEYKRNTWKQMKRDHVRQTSSPKLYIIAIALLLLTFIGTFFSVLSFCLRF
ncbi:hypothetical protein FNV43_RR00999 [Rhamnella rubrinervis]|uniref:Uncharacterized protein n=1 Tax=Rhamnella rubrinervis TaxID=2594499 RepID=A0A8K0MSG3_9ROSA|nr:hypothetical protein FNV43_RR00999 [Rhamnella rubrinervis]